MDINFEYYKIFYHAARLENFSEAATSLYISQSAVSQAVKNLELKLGGQLFFRSSRSVKLTSEGKMLYQHIEQAYHLIKSAEKKFQEMQSLDEGEIRIGASDTVCKYFLIPCLEGYNAEHPGIKIQVVNRTSAQIIEILKNGAIDLGIVTLPVKDKGIETVEFKSVEDIFVASSRFASLEGRKVSLKELAQYPLLMLEKDSITRQNLDDYLHRQGVELFPEIELESIDLLVEFARIGLGVSHVLKESALEEITRHRLFPVRLQEELPPRKLGICTLQNVPLSRAAEEFVNCLQEINYPQA